MSTCIKTHIEEFDTFARHLGIHLVLAEPGHGIASLDLDERHKNGVGLAHGGALFALADMAFALACNACQGGAMLNVTSSITFMKAGKVGPITAEAVEVQSGAHLGTYRVDIRDGDGTMIAVSTITGYRTALEVR